MKFAVIVEDDKRGIYQYHFYAKSMYEAEKHIKARFFASWIHVSRIFKVKEVQNGKHNRPR